ncbi:uncharacterized protein METZ01_LOCUS265981, partial [marine metagenome]
MGHKDPRLNFVAISDMGHPDALHYLLVRDSVHGSMDDQVRLDGNYFITDQQNVRVLSGGKPGTIPWDTFDVDVVIDATGRYLKREELEKHLEAGAKRVFVTRTPDDEIDRVVIPGINEDIIQESDQIISATSSTTQVLALMLKILNQHYTVRRAMMTTVHAYTADQPLA